MIVIRFHRVRPWVRIFIQRNELVTSFVTVVRDVIFMYWLAASKYSLADNLLHQRQREKAAYMHSNVWNGISVHVTNFRKIFFFRH